MLLVWQCYCTSMHVCPCPYIPLSISDKALYSSRETEHVSLGRSCPYIFFHRYRRKTFVLGAHFWCGLSKKATMKIHYHAGGKYVDECSDAAFFGASKANTYIGKTFHNCHIYRLCPVWHASASAALATLCVCKRHRTHHTHGCPCSQPPPRG